MFKRLSLLLLLGYLGATSWARDLPATGGPVTLPVSDKTMTLYIGTYTHDPEGGICAAHFDPATGELSPARTVAATPNPSFLAASADGRFLYAVNESGSVAGENQGGLSAFRIETGTDQLTILNSLSQGGTLCHLTLDATGKWLLAAAYSAGTVSTWPLQADGSLGARTAISQHTGSGPDQNRQREPHAHQIVLSPDNSRAFSADLGADKVTLDDFNPATGELVPATPPSVPLASGAGPRHVALSPSGQFLYVVSELNNTITAFKDALGTPQQIQVVSTLPADFTGQSFAAEIAVHPSGRFLYASNRGHDSLACYSIAPNGQIELLGITPTGRNPRHFTLDPTGNWLLVGNQNDQSISVFSINSTSGLLTHSSSLKNIPGDPVCLLFSNGQ